MQYPANYVERIQDGDDEPAAPAAAAHQEEEKPVTPAVAPAAPAAGAAASAGKVAIALYESVPSFPSSSPLFSTKASAYCSATSPHLQSYAAAEDNELSFREGERITAIEEASDDWWSGTGETGEEGLFPSNYVEVQQ